LQGDLLCRISVETPVNLTSKQKKLLEEFQETLSGGSQKHCPKSDSWLDSVKNFIEDLKN